VIIDNHKNEICSKNFDGTNQKSLVRTIIEDYSTDPGRIKCSPDGDILLFTASAHESNKEYLYKINNETNIFSPLLELANLTLVWSTKIDYAFHPKLKKLAIFKLAGYNDQRSIFFNLYLYDIETQELQPIIIKSTKNPNNLNFSPSGRFIAFTSEHKLFIYDLTKNDLATINNTSTYSFHSNGNDIIFCEHDTIFVSSLYNIQPKPISVIQGANSNLLAIAKDGSSLIYNVDNNLVKIDLPARKLVIEDFLSILYELNN
jgi:Tol biopolymer transport system component